MKNKFKFLVGIVCLFNITAASAQIVAGPGTTITGTPYLNDAFSEGEIAFTNSSRKAPIRYNIFQDLIEFQQNGKPLVLDPNANVKKVKFNNNTFVVEKFEYKGKTKNGFLTLLDSGKVTLFAKKVVVYIEPLKGRALDGGDVPARFNRSSDVYFYKVGNGEPVKVESVKKMIATFPDKQEELTQFVKKEKISSKKEEELVKLVQYYNSL